MTQFQKPGYQPNRFKQALAAGQVQFGVWSTLACAPLSEILTTSDLDWVLFDTEHAPNDLATLMAQLNAIKGSRLLPVARPVSNNPVSIRQLLDIGFNSLLIPQVQSAEEAATAVQASLYPPKGLRGLAGAHRASMYGTQPEYFDRINDDVCVMCQIETEQAVSQLAAIGRVPGVDAIFVGPRDLSANMGSAQTDTPEMKAIIRHIGQEAQAAGIRAGIVADSPATAASYLTMGYSVVSVCSEVRLFRDSLRAVSQQVVELHQKGVPQ